MKIKGEPRAFLSNEARQLLNLYESLGERAEIFLPRHIYDNLTSFVKLCFEEPDDPAVQQSEINRYLLKFREDIPGYTDVALMLCPHHPSKAFELSGRRGEFMKKIDEFLDTEAVSPDSRVLLKNIKDTHDFSVGTPPVRSSHIEFISQVQLGGQVRDLRKYRDVIGVTGDLNEAHWNYLMDTLEQMIGQSTHYTTGAEKADFLNRMRWAVNFKGLNGMITTVVSGNADKAVSLLRGEVFGKNSVQVLENPSTEELFEQMRVDTTSVFVVKARHMRVNPFSGEKWFPLLTRLVIVDDSRESRSSSPGTAARVCSSLTTAAFSTASQPASLSSTTANFSPAKVLTRIFLRQKRNANMPKIRRRRAAAVSCAAKSNGSAAPRKRVCAATSDASNATMKSPHRARPSAPDRLS